MNQENQSGQNIPVLKEIIDERKQKSVETLSVSYAKNRLPLEEYERLVEYINKIESERELMVVEKIVAEYSVQEQPASGKTKPPSYYDEEDANYPERNYNNSKENITVLSNRTFQGPVKSGSQYISILGTEKLIIRKSDLQSHQTVLNLFSILGESIIYVEPGIEVINRVVPILGNSEIKFKGNTGDRELIISGAAILGNITVKQLKY